MDLQEFIRDNAGAEVSQLRLKYHNRKDMGFDIAFAITQIECRQRFRKKLSETLAADPEFLFPDRLVAEQSTSDILASYHSALMAEGSSVVDLTAGLGIDALHFAKRNCKVTALELDKFRAEIMAANMKTARAANVKVENADCREWIARYNGDVIDTLFIDPARRDETGGRVYAISDCHPDVIGMIPRMSEIARTLIVKMSPMLDIDHTLSDIPATRRIIAVGTATECKELVAIVPLNSGERVHPAEIEAVTITSAGISSFIFNREEEAEANIDFGTPKDGDILYEPLPATMKAAPFKLLSQRYGLTGISANSHLYFSDKTIENIPATRHTIIKVLPYASKVIKRFGREYPKIDITCRNFGISADMLRRKLKVSDGGNLRLFATTDSTGNQILIVTSKA